MNLLVCLITLFFFWSIFYTGYRIIKFIIKFVIGDLNEVHSPKHFQKKECLLIAKSYVAMAKLTPNYYNDNTINSLIRKYADIAFREIAKVYDKQSSVELMMQSFAEVALPGNSIKVSDLKDELVGLSMHDSALKREFIIGLLSIAYADGGLDENQDRLLHIVRDSLDFDYSVYYRVQKTFWERMKVGRFGDYEEFERRRNEWNGRHSNYNSDSNENNERHQEYRNQNENNRSGNTSYSSSITKELEKAYSVLGLLPDATIDEINSQKRLLLKKYHPDLYTNQGESAVKEATKKSQEINQAYDIIKKDRGF